MDLLLLPGNSKSNKEWIDKVEKELKGKFENTFVHYYDHWWSGDENSILDMDNELDKLESFVRHSKKYVIFAKSAGALLALYGMYEGVLSPEVCIFVGTAVNFGRTNNFAIDNWLTNYAVPTLFIQKTADPAISVEELSSLLVDKNASHYSLFEIPGDDHFYSDLASLRQAMEDFVDLDE